MRLPTTQERVVENRLRRMALRHGLRVVKSRRLDPRAADQGYLIWDPTTETVLSPAGPGTSPYGLANLEALEDWLEAAPEDRPAPLGAPPVGSSPEDIRRREARVREAVSAYRRAVQS